MFYKIVATVILGIFKITGIKVTVNGKENLPKNSYVVVAPHKSWLDPVILGVGIYPKQFTFMAKKELFKNPIFSWFITSLNAFPVDRENPGPSAVKVPVKKIKNNEQSLLIFPTGTRNSSELKAGAFLIAKLAKAPIIPINFTNPESFKQLFKKRNFTINIGKPIWLNPKQKLDQNYEQSLDKQLNSEFKTLEPVTK